MGELNQQSEHTLQRQARQAQREAKWLARWQTRGWATRVLWPASWLFQKIAAVRKWAFTHGWRAQYRMPVPVVVVGGIMIGGVGKTPIVAQLVQQFGVTTLHFVPPLLRVFVDEPQTVHCHSLRTGFLCRKGHFNGIYMVTVPSGSYLNGHRFFLGNSISFD